MSALQGDCARTQRIGHILCELVKEGKVIWALDIVELKRSMCSQCSWV